MARPISPRLHGIIDYAFFGVWAGVPRLLQLPAPVRATFTGMGAAQGMLNAFTDQPYAVRRLIPFRVHGRIEKWSAPLYVALPLLAGAWGDRRSRVFFLGLGALLVTNFNLTDWRSIPRHRPVIRLRPPGRFRVRRH